MSFLSDLTEEVLNQRRKEVVLSAGLLVREKVERVIARKQNRIAYGIARNMASKVMTKDFSFSLFDGAKAELARVLPQKRETLNAVPAENSGGDVLSQIRSQILGR